MKKLSVVALGLGLAAAGLAAGPASAQDKTLDIIKQRGHLRCQIGLPTPGFYNVNAQGQWEGFDVDICRAVASAIFGDPKKVEFQSVSSQARFTNLANGESDMLSRTATWTSLRDSQLGLNFTATNFYDGQGFLVPNNLGLKSAKELKGAKVCVLTGTTTELNLADYSRANGLDMQPVVFEDNKIRDETYLKGGCDAMTNDKSSLAASRSAFPDPKAHTILPETISKEPLAAAVRQGDSEWHTFVKWVNYALIQAEEFGITQANIDERIKNAKTPDEKRFLGIEGEVMKGFRVGNDFAVKIIKGVGNYGEIYERTLGSKTQVNIPREGSPNALWTKGGLLYAPPFR